MSRETPAPAASIAPRRHPHAAVSRADLVRLLDTLPPDRLARAAAALGFREPQAPPGSETQESEGAAVTPWPALELWRMETMTFRDGPGGTPAEGAVGEGANPGVSLTQDDLTSPGRSLHATPRPALLTLWSRLWPELRAALQASVPGRAPDVSALVRGWVRGEVVRRIPRVQRRVWAERVSVWVDRSPRLVPFWSDQGEVCARLRDACGKSGLRVRRLDARAQAQTMGERGDLLGGFRADPETPVLVLGDLGVFGSPADRAAWLRTARQLHGAGVRVAALVPAPPDRWSPAIAKAWGARSWEQTRRSPVDSGQSGHSVRSPDPGVRGPASPEAAAPLSERRRTPVERLLRLSSVASLVQPGLLRALRRLLPASSADAATEADVWAHPDVRAADGTGMVLHPEAARRWREELVHEEAPELLDRVSATIERWHAGLPKEFLRVERLVWLALAPTRVTVSPEDRADALGFAARLEGSLRRCRGSEGPTAAAVRRCAGTMLLSMPDVVYQALPGLKRVWGLTFEGASDVRVPAGLDFEEVQPEPGTWMAPRWWAVRQVASEVVFSLAGDSDMGSGSDVWRESTCMAWPPESEGPGSPVAWLLEAGGHVWVSRGGEASETQLVLEDGMCVQLPSEDRLVLRTDRCTVTLTCWSPEPWAAASGRDRYGLWAEADVKGVVARFRWIPPGRFWMGSPESEAGSEDHEGPQHHVTWTEGRWLCDTPVTQALWEAVMGANPSWFKSPERPVEQVSWEDCQGFLVKLNGLAPGLEARLPSEAEWEYACRAGTKTATWKGDLEILGERNVPLLDDIAWYGGNCGVGFELENGWDTTGELWKEKQYDFEKGGTHSVREKIANPLGLFDMLGNVFEWCLDAGEEYFAYPYAPRDVIDPSPNRTDSRRVSRGGSWYAYARRVRAASRIAYAPGFRGVGLGFRLARGPEPGPRSGASGGAAERTPNRVAGAEKKGRRTGP